MSSKQTPACTTASTTVWLSVEQAVRGELDRSLRRRLKRRCLRMLAALGLEGVELSVYLAGDATVARLNANFRNKRGTTDVLSFSQAPPEAIQAWKDGPPLTTIDGPERILGDLVISLEVVRGRSPSPEDFEADLVTLLAHGLLHLMGHDHQRAPERKAMLALQDRLVIQATGRGRVRVLQR